MDPSRGRQLGHRSALARLHLVDGGLSRAGISRGDLRRPFGSLHRPASRPRAGPDPDLSSSRPLSIARGGRQRVAIRRPHRHPHCIPSRSARRYLQRGRSRNHAGVLPERGRDAKDGARDGIAPGARGLRRRGGLRLHSRYVQREFRARDSTDSRRHRGRTARRADRATSHARRPHPRRPRSAVGPRAEWKRQTSAIAPGRRMSVATRLLTMTGLAVVLAFAPRILLAEEVPPPAAPETEQAGPGEEIVVTATRTPRPIRDVAAVVIVVPRAELERSPAKTLDELLPLVPSLGLFRRSSSLAADPSSQGVTLRGVGPSGVSRSLVLVDGIPANDPFGGWVYWRAIPRLGIERLEVVPGGGSALYGNYALSGVSQVVSRPIVSQSVQASGEYGSFSSGLFGLRAADRWGPIGGAVDGELLNSDGYPVVADYNRGPVDGNAPSEHGTINARVEGEVSSDLSIVLRGGYFYEDQNGGTQFTTAAVRRFEYAASARATPGSVGLFDLAIFGHAGTFRQNRARFLPNRSREVLSGNQDVPTHDFGAGLVWTSHPLPMLGSHTLTVGSDARRITADTQEHLFPAPAPTPSVVSRDARGEQRLYGVFAQDVYDASEAVQLSLTLRYDRWDNVDASRVEHLSDGSTKPTRFAGRSDSQVSPKAGLRVHPIDWLTLRASAYRAFRAPTLNELYRPFQVGTVFTQANENLGPETLVGGEAGVDVKIPLGLGARLTTFRNELKNPITNVTVGQNLRH